MTHSFYSTYISPSLRDEPRQGEGSAMINLDSYEILFLVNAFILQLILIFHFALRKRRFELALRYGWIVYALSIPAAILSIYFLRRGVNWSLWMGGFIYLVWALYGYAVEYVLGIEWRSSLRWSIFVPYVILYLATVMFYWWPIGLIDKPLWYVFAVLFIISTYLNVTSHERPGRLLQNEKSG
jgi:hypothetical protein